MRLRPQSLRGRLIASAILFIVLAILATGVAVEVSLHRFVRGQIDQRLDGQLLSLEEAFEPGSDGRLRPIHSVDAPPFDNPHTGWVWLARSGPDLWSSVGLRGADLHLPPLPTQQQPHPQTLEGIGPEDRPIRARTRVVLKGGHPLVVLAAAPIDAETGPLRDAVVPVVVALSLLGGGLVAATLLQVRLGLRPLEQLRADLAAVRGGRLERLPVLQPAEVRPLAGEVNSLLDQHAINLERARRHVANLAHALKTPLATLSLALETQDHDGSLRGLTLAMDRRIRHHLTRARAAALGPTARIRLPLADRVADHVTAFGKIYADRGLACRIGVAADLRVACDGQDLDEMIGNLLDNAFKWASTTVEVAARQEGRRILVSIEDDGPGVAPEAIATVLKPGKRLDESTPGDGFGLAIVQELAELYGGGVTLGPAVSGGLRVTLDLPGASGLD